MKTTLVIPDIHIPYEHPRALAFLRRIQDKYHCESVVSVGDVYDMHSLSYHDHDPDLPGPAQELAQAKKRAALWYRAFPHMLVTTGNHDALISRKLSTHGLPGVVFNGLSDLFDTPKWKWVDEAIVPGGRHKIWFRHHWAPSVINRGGDGGYSVVCGHTHSKAQVIWAQYPSHSTFSLITGCLINTASPAFAYNKYDAKRPILACATIIDGQPHIHRMFP